MFHHHKNPYLVILNEGNLTVRRVAEVGLSCSKLPAYSVNFAYLDENGNTPLIEDFECIHTHEEDKSSAFGDTKVSCWANFSSFYFLSFELDYEDHYGERRFVTNNIVKHSYVPDMKVLDIVIVNRFVIVDALIINKSRFGFILRLKKAVPRALQKG